MTMTTCRTLPLLTLLLVTGCASPAVRQYRGDLELIAVTGATCPEKGAGDSHVPLELVLKQHGTGDGQPFAGYFRGPDIQTGHFLGEDLARLVVDYPGDADAAPRGHTLSLSPTADGMSGELHENSTGDSESCYFEKTAITMKQVATGNESAAAFDTLQKVFAAEVQYNKGKALLKDNNPDEAIRHFTESLKLRLETAPYDPSRAYTVQAIAMAHFMAGREQAALKLVRDLINEPYETIPGVPSLTTSISAGLCADASEADGDQRQRAAEQLMDAVAREFSGRSEVSLILNTCYRELGQEHISQEDPYRALDYFRKAVALNPRDSESIFGVVISLVATESPTEARTYLQEHQQIILDSNGQNNYNASLSYLYAAEAEVAEHDKDYPGAERHLREALSILPAEHTHIINLSRLLGKMNKGPEALQLLEDARKGCQDEPCRQEYTDEITRQKQIESLMDRLEQQK